MDSVLSMLAKPADMLSLEFRSIKRRIHLWDNTSLNVVIQRKLMNKRIIDSCRRVEKLRTIEAIYIKKLKPQLSTRDKYRGAGIDIEVLLQIQKV